MKNHNTGNFLSFFWLWALFVAAVGLGSIAAVAYAIVWVAQQLGVGA